MVVDVFEVVVGGFRSFHVLVTTLRRILMLNTGIFTYCENLYIFVSNHPFKFQTKRPVCEYFTSFFQWDVKRPSGCYMHNRASCACDPL